MAFFQIGNGRIWLPLSIQLYTSILCAVHIHMSYICVYWWAIYIHIYARAPKHHLFWYMRTCCRCANFSAYGGISHTHTHTMNWFSKYTAPYIYGTFVNLRTTCKVKPYIFSQRDENILAHILYDFFLAQVK